MTPRERVEAALRGDMPDMVPFTVYENKIALSEAERSLRNDGMCVVQRRVPAYKICYREVQQERVYFTGCDGREHVRTTVHTPAGTLSALDQPASSEATTWHEERLFKSSADYEPLECMIRDREYKPNHEAFAAEQALVGGDAIVRASTGYSPLQALIYTYMGLPEFSVQWLENRERVMRLYDALTDDRRKVYEVLKRSPALAVNVGGNVSPEVVGLDRFRNMILPHYDEAAETLHPYGKLVGVHFDANTRLLAPDIACSKLDYIEAFTPAPTCDMSVAEAREAWRRKALWINFPSSVHLESIESIEETTRQILKEAAPGDRFLIGITENVPPDRWQANFRAILRVIRQTGWTPISA